MVDLCLPLSAGGYVQAAFGAAGAGGRGKTDPRAAWEAVPAEGAESNAGKIPG